MQVPLSNSQKKKIEIAGYVDMPISDFVEACGISYSGLAAILGKSRQSIWNYKKEGHFIRYHSDNRITVELSRAPIAGASL